MKFNLPGQSAENGQNTNGSANSEVTTGNIKKNRKNYADNPDVLAMINKGGGSAKISAPGAKEDPLQGFTIPLYKSQLDTIGEIIKRYPTRAGRKIPISKKQWIINAVNEKIARDNVNYPKE